MSKRIFVLVLLIALSASPLIGWAVAAKAQGAAPTPTETLSPPTPNALATPEIPASPTADAGALPPSPTVTALVPPTTDANAVTFTQLKRAEIQLLGPYDIAAFSFFLPADWKLQAGTELHLSLGVSFNAVVQSQPNAVVTGGGGTLTARLNGNALGVLPLDQVGENEWNVPIPASAWESARTDSRMDVTFILNSGLSCFADQHMNIIIHPSSYLILPHDLVQPDTSLVNFPRPIYEGTFHVEGALMIVPDQPSPAELQAALTTAAGFGNRTGGGLTLDMTTLSNVRPDQPGYSQATSNHLIFVGKAASLPVLATLQLPSPPQGGQFQSIGGGSDDGYVEMVDSPWSIGHVALIVSANTDAGVVKAAEAVSTGVLRPNSAPNLAVIQEVQSAAIPAPQPVDHTLADMGYSGDYFQGRGHFQAFYDFTIQPGHTVGPDAYFELVYGHSALLNYDRSAITVLLNNRPIGSVRMSDQTAAHATNLARFTLPASAVQPGKNQLLVDVTSIPTEDCTPPGVQVLWLQLWPQSALHLPVAASSVSPSVGLDLASYPKPFVYDPRLSNTAFVLAHDDAASWREAAQIAEYLGWQASGPLTELSVFYGDNFPLAERAKYHLLVIGRASQLPLVGEMNSSLPAPFASGTDAASQNSFQVTYRIPPNSPLGYLETFVSPWNSDRNVLAVLGNDAQGVSWAAAALIDPNLQSRLAGNFAAVTADQVVTTDTLAAFAAAQGATPTPNGPALAPFLGSTPEQTAARPPWILPALEVTAGLLLLILIWALVRSIMRGRGGRRRGV